MNTQQSIREIERLAAGVLASQAATAVAERFHRYAAEACASLVTRR